MSICWSVFVFFLFFGNVDAQYTANWTSIDSRPLPLWYDEAKFGIFTHWGVYSVPAFVNEWFWIAWKTNKHDVIDAFMHTHYKPNTTYQDFASMFTALDFNANEFAEIVKSSGAKYFVFTTKHHEGYTMWPSNVSWNWNAVDVGPGRDLVGEIQQAILNVGGIRWGTYFSLMDWYHPYYLSDQQGQTNKNFTNSVMLPQIKDLVTSYKPDIVWVDGDWEMTSDYWEATEFLAWLYNESPVKDTVITNDRWGSDARCYHGGVMTCSRIYERIQPKTIQPHKFEDCDTVDGGGSWGYRRTMTAHDVHPLNVYIQRLIIAISTGGNYLLNIGPDHNGRVQPIFEERLRGLGSFVNAHEEAIFATKAWIFQNDSDSTIWYTSRVRNTTGLDPYRLYNNQTQDNTIIYAFVVDWPVDNLVNMPHVLATPKTTVKLFGSNGQNITLSWTQPFQLNGGIQVNIAGISLTKFASADVFVLKIEYAADQNVDPFGG